MKKLNKVMAIAAICTLWGSITTFAGEWKSDAHGWWYVKDDGNYIVSDWLIDAGKFYYFNTEGYMLSNTWIGNYYVGADGAMLINTITPDGYWVGSDGLWIENAAIELPRTPYADVLNMFKVNFQGTDSYYLYCFIDFKKDDLIDHGEFYELKNQEISSYFGDPNYWDYEGVVYSGSVYVYKNAQQDTGSKLTFENALDNAAIKKDSMSYQNGYYHWNLLKPDENGYFTAYLPVQAG